jgi:transposase
VPYRRVSLKEPLLGPFREWIGHRAPEVEYNGRVLFRELKGKGYRGKYDTVRKYLAPLRPATGNRQMTVRFETLPGQQAQVDWGVESGLVRRGTA